MGNPTYPSAQPQRSSGGTLKDYVPHPRPHVPQFGTSQQPVAQPPIYAPQNYPQQSYP